MTTQPPVSGDGQDDAPDPGTRSGEFLSERDPRLASFAKGGSRDTCGPCVELAAVLWDLSGTGWRCPGATDDELTGVLGRWQAIVSWAESRNASKDRLESKVQYFLGWRDLLETIILCNCLDFMGVEVKGLILLELIHSLTCLAMKNSLLPALLPALIFPLLC